MATCNEIHIIKDEARRMMKMTAVIQIVKENLRIVLIMTIYICMMVTIIMHRAWTLLSLTQ